MVDLHAHTDRSDGALSPRQLADLAVHNGLSALAITDHDTLDGYEAAAPHAKQIGLDLICGVELSASFLGRPIHILGYFLGAAPGATFRGHLDCIQQSRRERNRRLAAKLQSLGLDVTAEEAEALGRGQTGRPHFALVLVEKGYAPTVRQAFNTYLDERAPGFVARRDASAENVLRWIEEAGGISSWAHPGRFLRDSGYGSVAAVGELASQGLKAVEVFHADHDAGERQSLQAAADKARLAVTGGSDFHNPETAGVPLGGLNLPDSLLERLRERYALPIDG
ncbi:MAG TPA: PHP domain-containing protein [Bryobacterales bacterium]|nr:PHP domain-containing protein [Bryobacterales bacterium]